MKGYVIAYLRGEEIKRKPYRYKSDIKAIVTEFIKGMEHLKGEKYIDITLN